MGPSWDEHLPAEDLGSARAAEQPEPEAAVEWGRENPAEIGDELLLGVIIFFAVFFFEKI